MASNEGISAYAQAKKQLILLLLGMPVIAWLVPMGLTSAGLNSETVLAITIPLMLAWFVIGVVQTFRHACPRCGRSLFVRGFVGVPWPARTCSKCGCDLTLTF